MANNLNPDICDISGFDFGTVPKLGSNLEGLGDDLTAYLCNVLRLSRREDLDPVIRGGTEYDNSVWIAALTGMKSVGDPRFDMGELMSIALEKYLKPLEIQLKILQEGCHVTDGVLCDADGNEIPFYGKCEKPDLEMFSYDSISQFVSDLWVEKLNKAADDFISYLKTNYVDKYWNIEFFAMGDGDLKKIKYGASAPIFYVKLTKDSSSKKYYKYFFDKKDYISNAFKKSINIVSPRELQKNFYASLKTEEGPDFDLVDAISGPIWPEKLD
jgi:hypothetical protein